MWNIQMPLPNSAFLGKAKVKARIQFSDDYHS